MIAKRVQLKHGTNTERLLAKERVEHMNNNNITIFDMKQAYFYIREGVTPLYVNKHSNGKIFYVFDKTESYGAFIKWLESCKQLKINR